MQRTIETPYEADCWAYLFAASADISPRLFTNSQKPNSLFNVAYKMTTEPTSENLYLPHLPIYLLDVSQILENKILYSIYYGK